MPHRPKADLGHGPRMLLMPHTGHSLRLLDRSGTKCVLGETKQSLVLPLSSWYYFPGR